jgi:hypothetical protein
MAMKWYKYVGMCVCCEFLAYGISVDSSYEWKQKMKELTETGISAMPELSVLVSSNFIL